MTGAELRAIRKALGLSAARFARLLGAADGSTVRRWERQDVVPNPQATIATLANALPEARDWLLQRMEQDNAER